MKINGAAKQQSSKKAKQQKNAGAQLGLNPNPNPNPLTPKRLLGVWGFG